MTKKPDDLLARDEISKRRDDALRRALTTPRKPKQESAKPIEPRTSTKKPAPPAGES